MRNINIFLDDVRSVPDDGKEWILVHTVQDCIRLLEKYKNQVETLSLDHDLGTEPDTGYDVALWCYEHAVHGFWDVVPTYVLCHSANPVGRRNILLVVERIYSLRDRISGVD